MAAIASVILVALVALAVGVSIVLGAPSTRHTDAACMALIRSNNVPLTSRKADYVGNYAGCQQTYWRGVLVGYARGSGACNEAAYHGTFDLHLSGSAYHRYMGTRHCVLFEDWSWGAE
jgi:hypothetical protein